MDVLSTAGKSLYSELINVCVWNKSAAGMGALYRSKHEMIFVYKVGTEAEQRNSSVLLLKTGEANNAENLEKFMTFSVDPGLVTMPFLSILGMGEGLPAHMMTADWHENIRSKHKRLVTLDAATGADSHVQVTNRLRLVQEGVGWMNEVFGIA